MIGDFHARTRARDNAVATPRTLRYLFATTRHCLLPASAHYRVLPRWHGTVHCGEDIYLGPYGVYDSRTALQCYRLLPITDHCYASHLLRFADTRVRYVVLMLMFEPLDTCYDPVDGLDVRVRNRWWASLPTSDDVGSVVVPEPIYYQALLPAILSFSTRFTLVPDDDQVMRYATDITDSDR